jgi:DNA (cytosine-5)-methyltransferase 1
MTFTACDLFSGGGGLTVGLKAAGFKVCSAVEIEHHAHKTYKANHPRVRTYNDDIRRVPTSQLLQDAGGSLALVAGCPPCQGFTSLTSKYRREDPRNRLIEEMQRIVVEARPRAVMMENVPGLAGKGADKFDAFVSSLEAAGYIVDWRVLQVADFGTPQYRRRLVLFAGLGFKIGIPEPTHSKTGADGKKPWRKISEVISNLGEADVFDPKTTPQKARLRQWHVVRRMSDENKERLRWAKPGGSWRDIPEEHRVPCHRGKYRGFSNVYGRMAWSQTAPTMTGGCTTLSKGRFGHPSQLRTISVREAALLQEFPDDYWIATPHMDKACDIIGNALPCGFATAMAKHVKAALENEAE